MSNTDIEREELMEVGYATAMNVVFEVIEEMFDGYDDITLEELRQRLS